MSSLDAYLDRVCARLQANPAEVGDIRRELRSHLEERLQETVAEGVSVNEALEAVLLDFGEAGEVHAGLRAIHQGVPWWLARLHSAAVGALLGLAITLALSLRLLPVEGPSPAAGLAMGALVGLCSIPGKTPVAGLVIGSLGWMAACLAAFLVDSVASPSADWLRPFDSLLLSPILGSFFGVAVGAISSFVISLSCELRPRLR